MHETKPMITKAKINHKAIRWPLQHASAPFTGSSIWTSFWERAGNPHDKSPAAAGAKHPCNRNARFCSNCWAAKRPDTDGCIGNGSKVAPLICLAASGCATAVEFAVVTKTLFGCRWLDVVVVSIGTSWPDEVTDRVAATCCAMDGVALNVRTIGWWVTGIDCNEWRAAVDADDDDACTRPRSIAIAWTLLSWAFRWWICCCIWTNDCNIGCWCCPVDPVDVACGTWWWRWCSWCDWALPCTGQLSKSNNIVLALEDDFEGCDDVTRIGCGGDCVDEDECDAETGNNSPVTERADRTVAGRLMTEWVGGNRCTVWPAACIWCMFKRMGCGWFWRLRALINERRSTDWFDERLQIIKNFKCK